MAADIMASSTTKLTHPIRLARSVCFRFARRSWIYGSSDAVPFWIMLVIMVLWFCVSVPLVFLGSYFGYKKDAIEFPVNTSNIPRQIPDQPWFMNIWFTIFIGGILPFGACFVELFFILSSIWTGWYYYVFGFLLIVFAILLITAAEITLLFCYFQLCAENYHWWWRSFMTGGSTGLWVFMYSAWYFKGLGINTFATYLLYFGYMGAVSMVSERSERALWKTRILAMKCANWLHTHTPSNRSAVGSAY